VVGTDEIAEFAERIGARLVLTVNAGHATAEEAGDGAAYVRDRHGAGWVSLWEIGNELYMEGDLTGPVPDAHRA
jgi:alpha-L-arabinofuranosidase